MKFTIRLYIALALVLGVMACSRPATEADSSKAQPTAPAASTPTPPAEKSGNDAATPGSVQQDGKSTPVERTQAPKVATRVPGVETPVPKGPIAPAAETVTIPSGTMITVAMIDAVGTDTNKAGDTFSASLADPVVVEGKTVLPKGTKVRGRIETLDEPGRVKGKAAISLVLTQLVRNGKTYAIATHPFTAQAEPETKKNALKVGGGAALGAIVGAIAGGKKGAAVGAAVGGGAGTTAVLVTKGAQMRIDSETKINFVLKDDIDLKN